MISPRLPDLCRFQDSPLERCCREVAAQCSGRTKAKRTLQKTLWSTSKHQLLLNTPLQLSKLRVQHDSGPAVQGYGSKDAELGRTLAVDVDHIRREAR